jgi:hypothetical protein
MTTVQHAHNAPLVSKILPPILQYVLGFTRLVIAGFYQPFDTGLSTCYPCLPGQTSSNASASCSQCPVPLVADASAGVYECVACDPGYIPSPSQASCVAVPRGYYDLLNGTRYEAVACPAGRYAPDAASFGNTSADACLPCPMRTFNDLDGSWECQACPVSTTTPANGSSSCEYCPALIDDTTGACIICTGVGDVAVANVIVTSSGNIMEVSCQNCQAGYEKIGLDCVACPVGRANPLAGSECSDCVAGRYTTLEATIECAECSPGYYQENNGTDACEKCPAGRASDYGQSACDICAAGNYTALEAQAACVQCPIGRYSASAEASTCVGCTGNTYTDEPGMSVPLDCPLGQIANSARSGCTPCLEGTFSAGASTCTDCSVGTSTNGTTGASTCWDCAPGYYSDVLRTPECVPCAPGSFIGEYGADVCTACPVGRYADVLNTTLCMECTGKVLHPAMNVILASCNPITTVAVMHAPLASMKSTELVQIVIVAHIRVTVQALVLTVESEQLATQQAWHSAQCAALVTTQTLLV